MPQDKISEKIEGQSVTQGKFQVSIGTSIALETLFGVNDNIAPTKPLPYTRYKHLLINIRTLIRNVYGAVQKELKVEWPADRYLQEVLREMEMIPIILDDQSFGKLGVIFYLPTYNSLAKEFPNAIIRTATKRGVGVQHYEAVEQYCIARLAPQGIRDELPIAVVDTKLPPADEMTAIITHLPVDLLPFTHTTLVELVETHTGVIKGRTSWHTKLSGSGLDRIPFDKWSIQWFGDGKTFTPYPPLYRKAILAIANENLWNQTTTPRLIKVQLKKIPDQQIRSSLEKIL